MLETNDVDLVWVPRVNTVKGLTDEHCVKWGWRVTKLGWVNYPDYQSREFKNSEDIRWHNKVHERIFGAISAMVAGIIPKISVELWVHHSCRRP